MNIFVPRGKFFVFGPEKRLMMECCIEDMLPSGRLVKVASQRADVSEGRL